MFCNLNAEIARAGVPKKRLAAEIGCTPGTLAKKLHGQAPITLEEATKIKAVLGVEIPMEILFATSDNANGADSDGAEKGA